MPALFERAGNCEHAGSITGIYTVLVEGDDMNDPIADTVRGTLDGHIVLSRDLAQRGIFPAVDVLASVTRVFNEIAKPEHRTYASRVRELLGAYREASDLLKIGAYVRGSDPRVDAAVAAMPRIEAIVRQGLEETSSLQLVLKQLEDLWRDSLR
jgi:flagellum-specific ATP synthase